MEKVRGFEIAKGFENKGINLPKRTTKYSAGYDVPLLFFLNLTSPSACAPFNFCFPFFRWIANFCELSS